MEDILETSSSLLQSSSGKDDEVCSPFHTEMKHEGKYQYCKHFDGQNIRFVCCECEFEARIEDVLSSHVRLHNTQFGKDDCFYSCNICHYNIASAVQLEFHIKTCHKDKLHKQKIEVKKQEETQKVEGNDSDKDYSDVKLISNAEALFDDGSTTATASASAITENEEMSKKQTKTGQIECPVCGMIFLVSYLRKHKQSQTVQYNYKNRLENHLKIHSWEGKLYPCSYCKMRFHDSSKRSRHEKIHKKKLGLLEFKCNLCPQQYNCKEHLENHMKLHSGVGEEKL